MRHQPALITCLHSRSCFWTLGPRPLSIVPTISVPFRYRTILVNSPIGPRTHLASPLLSPHCSPLIPNRFSYCPIIVVLLFSLNPFVPHSDNGSRSTIVQHSIYTCTVASPGPHLDLLVYWARYAPVCISLLLLTLGLLGQSLAFVCARRQLDFNVLKIVSAVAPCRIEP